MFIQAVLFDWTLSFIRSKTLAGFNLCWDYRIHGEVGLWLGLKFGPNTSWRAICLRLRPCLSVTHFPTLLLSLWISNPLSCLRSKKFHHLISNKFFAPSKIFFPHPTSFLREQTGLYLISFNFLGIEVFNQHDFFLCF